MEYPVITLFFRLFLSAFLGALIGLEREWAQKTAGLKTLSLISLGSCLFIVASMTAFESYPAFDPSRVFGQIIVGVGFLGAGMIMVRGERIEGLTTAAVAWMCAAVGGTVGLGLYPLALWGTFLAIILIFTFRFLEERIKRYREGIKKVE